MDQSASVPFCFLAADSGAWSHGFMKTWRSEVLAMGKGIFGATTIIPDSIGWANCKAAISMTLKHLQDIETWQMRKVCSEWKIHTHAQYPNILQLMWHFMSFCITPFFCHPARSVWVMRAWPTFKTRRPTKKSQELVDRGILYGGFSSSPLWNLSPKMGGNWGNWGNRVSLSTKIFLEMSCGWAITVDICRYLILPSMVCLKLSKGCGFRWHEHWHLGSVYFEKNLNKSTSQYILVGVFRRF